MKTIGYLRVSTSKQEQFGGSIEAQKDLISQYCKMYGLDLVGFLEDASSAKSIKNRPAMIELLQHCRSGEADAIVCTKIDRMFRNTIEGLQVADEFQGLGVSLFFVEMGGTGADVSTARGRRIFAYDLVDAECERMRTGERTKAVLRHKRANGQQHSAKAPFGWCYKKGERQPEPIEQQALKLIWQHHFIIKMRPTDIAKAMSASTFKTRKGKKIWANSTISSVLQNTVNQPLFAQWEAAWLEKEDQQHATEHNQASPRAATGKEEAISQ